MNCLPTATPPTGLQQLPSGCFVASIPLPGNGFAFAPTDTRDIAANVPLTDCYGSVVCYVYPSRSDMASVLVSDCSGVTYGYALSGNTTCATPDDAECPDQSWSEGDFKYSVVGGCISRERVGYQMADGVYQHAVITVSGGSVVMVTEGNAVAAVRPELCTTQAAGSSTATPSGYLIESGPCNLLRVNINGELSAYANVQPAIGSGITVSGCGTQSDPFTVGYSAPAAPPNPSILNVLPGNGISVSVVDNVATVSLSPNASAVMPLLICGSGSNITVYGSPGVTYTLGSETVSVPASGNTSMTTSFGGQVVTVTVGATLLGYVVMPTCTGGI